MQSACKFPIPNAPPIISLRVHTHNFIPRSSTVKLILLRSIERTRPAMTIRMHYLACVAILVVWLLYYLGCLFSNYRKIRHLGVPFRIIPISPENPIWMIVDKKIFIPFFERLPFGTGSFTRYNWRGWEFKDKASSHLDMGDAFFIVTPGRNWFYLCNPEALADVFQRRIDFPRPLEIFGW